MTSNAGPTFVRGVGTKKSQFYGKKHVKLLSDEKYHKDIEELSPSSRKEGEKSRRT